MLKFFQILFLLLAFIDTSYAEFDDIQKVGLIKTENKKVTIVRGSQTLHPILNDIIRMDDNIITDSSGSLGIIFSDGAVMTIGPNTNIVIDEYKFEPITKNLSFSANLLEGQIVYTSGGINRINPGSAVINIPDGNVILLGTKVIINVK